MGSNGGSNEDALYKRHLRIAWLRSKARYQVIKRARCGPGIYFCNACQGVKKLKDCQVDHLVPLTPWVDWNAHMSRLMVGPDGMQLLCKKCHKEKTKAQAEGRKLLGRK